MTPSLPTTAKDLSALYEQDYYRWLETTAKLLRDGQLSALDITNLLEEIEDMGRSERRAVYTNLKILLLHPLKYRYQPERRSNSWKASIVEYRQRLNKALEESPSLQPYCCEIFSQCYQDAGELATAETGLAMDAFPVDPFLTPESALHPDYLA